MTDKAEFHHGQEFVGGYPIEAAVWCNENNAHIVVDDSNEDESTKYIIMMNPPPDPETILRAYEDAVQAHLDATARARGYDSTYTCLSYLNSTDAVWKREAGAFNAWRDKVWRKAHDILNAWQASGEVIPPAVAEVIAQLPEIDWQDPEEPEPEG